MPRSTLFPTGPISSTSESTFLSKRHSCCNSRQGVQLPYTPLQWCLCPSVATEQPSAWMSFSKQSSIQLVFTVDASAEPGSTRESVTWPCCDRCSYLSLRFEICQPPQTVPRQGVFPTYHGFSERELSHSVIVQNCTGETLPVLLGVGLTQDSPSGDPFRTGQQGRGKY